MNLNYKGIGQRIRNRRLSLGLTQQMLADKSGISEKYLSNIENGNSHFSFPVLISIANNLNLSADYILGDNLAFNGIVSADDSIQREIVQELSTLSKEKQEYILECARLLEGVKG
ncbi:MAG: helix-turn-helix domain-containing protein [Oscillospiraceae bacterium]|nr:helix-turn-helix domain-containing protein [Oscillospiraceae bacterium]